MMEKGLKKLTLDQQARYEIKVPGDFDASWVEWFGAVTIKVNRDDNDLSITTLTGIFDQAALHGILRKLYSLGLPLICVILVDIE